MSATTTTTFTWNRKPKKQPVKAQRPQRMPLFNMAVDPHNESPILITKFVDFFMEKGLNVPGLFLPESVNTQAMRQTVLATSKRITDSIRVLHQVHFSDILLNIPAGGNPDASVSSSMIIAAGEVFKRYLLSLHEPLFAFALYDSFLLSEQLIDLQDRLFVYRVLMKNLPIGYHVASKVVLCLLSALQHRGADARALAAEFSPVFLQPVEQLFYMENDIEKANSVVYSLVIECDSIWKATVASHRSGAVVATKRASQTENIPLHPSSLPSACFSFSESVQIPESKHNTPITISISNSLPIEPKHSETSPTSSRRLTPLPFLSSQRALSPVLSRSNSSPPHFDSSSPSWHPRTPPKEIYTETPLPFLSSQRERGMSESVHGRSNSSPPHLSSSTSSWLSITPPATPKETTSSQGTLSPHRSSNLSTSTSPSSWLSSSPPKKMSANDLKLSGTFDNSDTLKDRSNSWHRLSPVHTNQEPQETFTPLRLSQEIKQISEADFVIMEENSDQPPRVTIKEEEEDPDSLILESVLLSDPADDSRIYQGNQDGGQGNEDEEVDQTADLLV